MKTKALSLLSGAFALLLAAAPMIPTFTQVALADNAHSNAHHRKGDGIFAKLNLSDDQKAKIKQIHESTRQQMDQVLTDEQKTEWKTARQEHRKPKLNLTDDQKAKMKAIRADAKTQMDAVLTPEQKQQLDAMRAQWHQNHPKRN